MKNLILLLLLPFALLAQKFTPAEIARYQQQAKRVTIIRDSWVFLTFMEKRMPMRFWIALRAV